MSDRLDQLRQRFEAEPESRHFLQYAEELRRQGRSTEAEPVLEAGLKHHPNWIAAQVSLARCRLEEKRFEGAAAALEAVVRKDPTQMVAYRLLIDAYLGLGDGASASERLQLYKELNPQDPQCAVLETRLEELIASQEAQPTNAIPPMATIVVPSADLPLAASPAAAPDLQEGNGQSPVESLPASPPEGPAPLTPPAPPVEPHQDLPLEDSLLDSAAASTTAPLATPESLGFMKMATEPNIQITGGDDQPLIDLPMSAPEEQREHVQKQVPMDEPIMDIVGPSLGDEDPVELPLQDMSSSSLVDFPQSIDLPEAGNKHTESTLASLNLESAAPLEADNPSVEVGSPMEILTSEERPSALGGSGAYAVQAMINLPDGGGSAPQVEAADPPLDPANFSSAEPGSLGSVDVNSDTNEAKPAQPPELGSDAHLPSPLATTKVDQVPESLLAASERASSMPQTSAEPATNAEQGLDAGAADVRVSSEPKDIAQEQEKPVEAPDNIPVTGLFALHPPVGAPREVDLKSILSAPPTRILERGGRLATKIALKRAVGLDRPSPTPADAESPEVTAAEQSALNLDPNAGATVTLGGLYLEQGHSREAKKIFQEVLTEDPGNPTAQDGLSKARSMPPTLSAEDLLRGYSASDKGGLSEKKSYVLKNYLDRLKQGTNDDVS